MVEEIEEREEAAELCGDAGLDFGDAEVRLTRHIPWKSRDY